jgi:hypothetical protein
VSSLENPINGYVSVPYLHDHNSIELKDDWASSKNIHDMYFVTATFSNEAKPYFTSSTNHYLLAKFKDNKKLNREFEKYKKDKQSFIFSLDNELFEREAKDSTNYVSVYYLEYSETHEDYVQVASVVAKREKVRRAGLGHMNILSENPPKFTFPYSNNIVVLEVSSDKGHQSVNQYCEKTRRDISRKGITMTNLVAFSILEKLK